MRNYNSLSEIQADLTVGKISCKELVQSYLKRIDERKNLNAFLETFVDEALKQAEEIDAKIKSGKEGKLAGMVIAIKDNISYKGQKVSASSKILEGYTSIYNSTVVERLLDADAIIIGRTNCDEFAMGSSNENSAFGNVLNPADNERVPGGSSGGSAAAVAADLCDAALGTDTGGSVRQPAAFCGVFGLKPSYGRVSRYGLTAFASSFDCIGSLTKNAEDAALILEVISGKDKCDSTSYETPVPEYSKNLNSEKKFKIGLPKECFGEGLSLEIKNATDSLVKELSSKSFEIF